LTVIDAEQLAVQCGRTIFCNANKSLNDSVLFLAPHVKLTHQCLLVLFEVINVDVGNLLMSGHRDFRLCFVHHLP